MPTGAVPLRQLAPHAVDELTDTAQKILAEFGSSAARSELLRRIAESAARFDETTLRPCRPVDTDDGLYVLRGLPLEDSDVGPTPGSWATAGDRAAAWDVILLLLATAMGHPIAWEGQQEGRFVHNIVPSPGHEAEQTGASSTVLLSPHTEDAFHPGRAHLLLLACMRNHDSVATTAASVRKVRLDPADVALLSRPVLPILPDDAYTEAQSFAGEAPKIPALWQTQAGPTLRYDPAYTPLDEAPADYRAAYGRLTAELERVSVAVALEPGDVLVVDNDVVVHGRVPFKARYDGTDRWLKRASVRVPGRRTRPLAESDEHGYGQTALVALV
ncbi:TauD/TfdA family dioxygenase [Streptomyces sp. NPDC056479]|uniref:TauD/TfdA family dioxygenase n=1 Tax=Streptomyces sp. NPDC056479 TaxID=3345832 RepID=UPI00368FB110